ncbi:unnamed protein product [Penicillium viridicatum]
MSIPQINPLLQEAVRDNPGISTKAMREQFEKLLLQPFRNLEQSRISIQTMVIIIDALDECEGDNDIRLILQLLPRLQNIAAIRLRVLLTSRPDLSVRLGFLKIAGDAHMDFVLHDVPLEVIKHDISLFLDYRLREIRTERFLPANWPGNKSFQKLVALSVPLFIFAATICRIFEEPDWDPIDSLTEILTRQNGQSKLDKTYLPVLDRLLSRQHDKHKEKLVSEFQHVIGAIVTLESPLSVLSLAKLLDLPERLVHLRLDPLHSVIRVPDTKTVPVRLFHLSFRDFLLDPDTQKKTSFGIDEMEMHCKLATQCLLMCQNLRKNICGLPIDGTERTEIHRQTIDINLAPELQYACRYWAYHLVKCMDADNMMYSSLLFLMRKFLQKYLLYWLEAMSILGLTSEILGILDRLQIAISIIDRAPLQVYCAGLIFAPQTAMIRAQFKQEIPTWIYQLPQVEERWGADLQTLEGHSGSVYSVAFSPNGQLLASGSGDTTVRLWDTVTGAITQKLKGHSFSVRSVAFSPNGRLLACISDGNTVRLWDPTTGALTQTLNGSGHTICCLAFSPNGQLLASGSIDRTVRIWDLATGAPTQILKGHSGSVWSVAFSPNGRLLASGSKDGIVRIWDLATSTLTQTLEGHSSWVRSVAFSPNGQLLASGSSDETVRLWDPAMGTLTQLLKGHSDAVSSVAFSPNGQLLASGSGDKTVRFWDPAAGALTQTLEGHSGSVWSVAFSPNGQLLASGSGDETVRLWDPAAVALTQTLEGHSSWVRSVAFSPNGQLLVSGSDDKTMRLWDPETGVLVQTWDVGRAVTTVEFSNDGLSVHSNAGTLNIQSRGDIPIPHQPHTNRDISFGQDQWIKLNGEKALWLPVELRPICFEINGDTLALGHISGHISFIRFCI